MKVAVVSTQGRTTQDMGRYCSAAFRRLGHEAREWVYDLERGGWSLPAGARPWLRRWHDARFSAWLSRFKPRLVFVIKGQSLVPGLIERYRRACDALWVNWWIDDPGLLALSQKLSPAYDLFLTNDPLSVEAHRGAGAKRVDWLTFAHDPQVHHPVELSNVERSRYACEVVFAGRLTPLRVDALTPLVPYGLALWSEPKIAWVEDGQQVRVHDLAPDHPLRKAWRGDSIWREELAALYNASKICVNVHSHGEYDTNMRDFEATACGALLVTRDRPLVRQMFRVGGPAAEVVVYSGVPDLVEKVKYYLGQESERLQIAARGMARCRRDHPYDARMRRVLELLP
jgi:spore maturation protein CgeB